ncbi:MAG: Hsp20/alpha crystallin family protein [Chloroflexi bacterium]|nr:MAG: Hsp20/alpha crystallin family protein [Chloroflexota bacterium]
MAELTRWEPFRELMSLREAMDRLFEESFVRPGFGLLAPAAETLAVDMYETDDAIIVKASIPGIKPEDIDVSVTGDTLTIKGEIEEDKEVKEEQYYRRERRYGSFCRNIPLPVAIQADKAEAEFEYGVLTLRLPKAEAVKPKTIKVKAKK